MTVLRVHRDDVTIPAGKTIQVQCRIPPNFNTTNPLVLYEPTENR